MGNAKGGSVVNPVRSARISTMNSSIIGYGKVEVRAKMPKGDWVCLSCLLGEAGFLTVFHSYGLPFGCFQYSRHMVYGL